MNLRIRPRARGARAPSIVMMVALLLTLPVTSADVVYRSFDASLSASDGVLGNVDVSRVASASEPAGLGLAAEGGTNAEITIDVDQACAIGTAVDMKFLVPEDVTLDGARIGLVDLADGVNSVASVGVVNDDAVDVGLPGTPNFTPRVAEAARGSWHTLRAEVQGDTLTVSVDGAAPSELAPDAEGTVDTLRVNVKEATGAVRAFVDDVRVTPLLSRYFDDFTVNTWTSSYPDPGEVAELRSSTFVSAPTSMYIESRDANSNQGMGITNEFDVPSCLLDRIIGTGTTSRFHLPEGQPWGNAAFALFHLMADLPTPENGWTVPIIASVGDYNGDRLLDILYMCDGCSIPPGEDPLDYHTLVETSYPIPFGGWHEIDVVVRPEAAVIDVGTFPGLFGLATEDVVFDVRIDGDLVGTFDAGSSEPVRAAYMGTVWTRSWMSDDYASYWDDFKVRLDLAAPLCGDGTKRFYGNAADLAFDGSWLSGDDDVTRLTIDAGNGPVDVTDTGRATLDVPGGAGTHSVTYTMETATGRVLEQVCDVVTATPLDGLDFEERHVDLHDPTSDLRYTIEAKNPDVVAEIWTRVDSDVWTVHEGSSLTFTLPATTEERLIEAKAVSADGVESLIVLPEPYTGAPPAVSLSFANTDTGAPCHARGTNIALHVTDPDDDVESVTTRWNDEDWSTTSHSGAGTLMIAPREGVNTLHARAVDATGRVNETALEVCIDTRNPDIAITSPSRMTVSSPIVVWETPVHWPMDVVAFGRLHFRGTAGDAESGVARVQAYVDGVPVPTEGTTHWTAVVDPDAGRYKFTVRVWDAAGNSASATRAFVAVG